MRLLELRAEGWRNLAPLVFQPGPRVTILHGDNGQGKTNVIEAIYFLATLRSFRTSRAEELVRSAPGEPPAPRARLAARVQHRGLERSVDIQLGGAGSDLARKVVLDGKAARGAAAIFGAVSVVLFVPEDLLLPRAAPAARRRFLDLAVFNVERGYYREAAAFQRVVKSRNHVLKQGRADPLLLDAYDDELARTGARVVVRRRALVAELAPRARELFHALHANLPVEVRYRGAPAVDAARDEPTITAALLAGLRAARPLDERRRFTTFGPHTDDLDLVLDGRLAREHASQGQLRSLVLALKLAELTNVEARLGDAPVLLLDDVPSELDPTRRRFLFEIVARLDAQTVISVAERAVVPQLADVVDFRVARGRLERG
ncbi:MAG TPA: DNA replication and repair protein RecF [Polyangia bacterium]|nr:DNA replication and repair protein RecF [Polyangia bacterium]